MRFALGLLSVLVFAPSSFAGGDFNLTCSNTYVSLPDGVPTLEGDCIRIDQTYRHSQLVLEGLVNVDGTLVYHPGQASTFQETCGEIQVKENRLHSVCRTESAGFAETDIILPISNDDGQLHY